MSDSNDSDQSEKIKIIPQGSENELERLKSIVDGIPTDNSETIRRSEIDIRATDQSVKAETISEIDFEKELSSDDGVIDDNLSTEVDETSAEDSPFIEEPTNIFPEYKLFRNKYLEQESQEYMPKDLITIILNNTGSTKRTEIKMIDSRGEVRYHGMSGGSNHEWTTRIQNTRVMGDWRFEVSGILNDEKLEFNIDIPFIIAEFVPEPIIIEPEIVEVETGKDLISIDIQYNIPIIKVKGIGKHYETMLHAVNIFYFNDFLQIDPEDTANNTEIRVDLIQNWVNFVKLVFEDTNHPLILEYIGKGESLYNGTELPSIIKGIGQKTEEKLINNGFTNLKAISESSPDKIVNKIGGSLSKAKVWIADARSKLSETTSEREDTQLENIGDKTADIINGVGPATLKKLDAAGFGTINLIVNADINDLIKVLGEKKANTILHEATVLCDAST